MELWIRSQDRLCLIKADLLAIEDKEIRNYVKGSEFYENFVLGQYKTKERALEVLDEIQCFLNGSITKDIYVNGDYCGSWKTQITEKVYEMPEE